MATAARNLLPYDLQGKLRLLRETLKGHHGNVIVVLKSELAKELARGLANHLAHKLSESDKQKISMDFKSYVEGGSLYLRLDKQEAYRGNLVLGEEDAIRVRVMFNLRRASPAAMKEACRNTGFIP